jgi:hypothetical protein
MKTMTEYLSEERLVNISQVRHIVANLAKFGLVDPTVILSLKFVKTELHYVWFDDDGMRVYGTEVEAKLARKEFASYQRIVETRYVQTPAALLSDSVVGSRVLRHSPEGKDLVAQDFDCGFHVQVFQDGKEIGWIDSDRCFYYTAAPTVRDFIGWAWCSGLGRSKEITADLKLASAEVCKYVNRCNGRVMYEGWDKLMGEVYIRDRTVWCEGSPLINPTLAVATRLLTGKEHPGFNICW